MIIFKTLNRATAEKQLNQVLFFTNSFPLKDNASNKEVLIIDKIFKLFNVIQYVDTKDPKFKAIGGFRTESGEEDIDIIDRSEIFIQKLFNELKTCSSLYSTTQLIHISNAFLKLHGIKLFQKTNIIDAENSLLKELIENFLEGEDDSLIKEFIDLRLEIVFDSIYSYEEKIRMIYILIKIILFYIIF